MLLHFGIVSNTHLSIVSNRVKYKMQTSLSTRKSWLLIKWPTYGFRHLGLGKGYYVIKRSIQYLQTVIRELTVICWHLFLISSRESTQGLMYPWKCIMSVNDDDERQCTNHATNLWVDSGCPDSRITSFKTKQREYQW